MRKDLNHSLKLWLHIKIKFLKEYSQIGKARSQNKRSPRIQCSLTLRRIMPYLLFYCPASLLIFTCANSNKTQRFSECNHGTTNRKTSMKQHFGRLIIEFFHDMCVVREFSVGLRVKRTDRINWMELIQIVQQQHKACILSCNKFSVSPFPNTYNWNYYNCY